MAQADLNARVAALEAEVAQIKGQIRQKGAPKVPWWEEINGIFENDPAFEEAMKLGREYRESLRPKPRNH